VDVAAVEGAAPVAATVMAVATAAATVVAEATAAATVMAVVEAMVVAVVEAMVGAERELLATEDWALREEGTKVAEEATTRTSATATMLAREEAIAHEMTGAGARGEISLMAAKIRRRTVASNKGTNYPK
jgi:hypothetical protein